MTRARNLRHCRTSVSSTARITCGAVVEGLLTWALLQKEKEALKCPKAFKDKSGQVRPISKRNVSNLIAGGVRLGLIGKTAEPASWALKEFRNFIDRTICLGRVPAWTKL